MVEEILPGLYRAEIPLPRNPLKSLNSYFIKGGGRFLIIDTGMNREECLEAMLSAQKELNVDLEKTDFFITHLHSDHLGLVANFATDTAKIYFNDKERSIGNFDNHVVTRHWQIYHDVYTANGFPEDEFKRATENHPGRRFGLRKNINFSIRKEGDTIEIGDYLFRCVETPGHSPGHMCLYEASKKILIAGDHILFDITPNITFWPETPNSLKQYLASLDKVSALDIKLVLPGHRRLLEDHKNRIRELQDHHRCRLDEILIALSDGAKNTYQIAPHVTWDIDCKSWEEFPPAQKWFAFGETLAHVQYLEEEGKVQGKLKGNETFYVLAQ